MVASCSCGGARQVEEEGKGTRRRLAKEGGAVRVQLLQRYNERQCVWLGNGKRPIRTSVFEKSTNPRGLLLFREQVSERGGRGRRQRLREVSVQRFQRCMMSGSSGCWLSRVGEDLRCIARVAEWAFFGGYMWLGADTR